MSLGEEHGLDGLLVFEAGVVGTDGDRGGCGGHGGRGKGLFNVGEFSEWTLKRRNRGALGRLKGSLFTL
jgi:hypothetical protein